MNYKTFIYLASIILSTFAVSGINFDGFIKKNKVWEARILGIILCIALGYLLGSFIISFIELTSIA